MLVEPDMRAIYFKAKHNLTCPDDALQPEGLLALLPDGMTVEQRRGCLSIRQLALLRTQMMADLAIFGMPTVRRLHAHERVFLRECGINLKRKPWRQAAQEIPPAETCQGS